MDDGRVIQALLEAAPPILNWNYKPDCCIAGTVVGIEALRYFGIEAWPLSVSGLVFNPAGWKIVTELGRIPQEADVELRPMMRERGYYAVHFGYDESHVPPPGKWNGHLVLYTETTIVDLTIAQATRPKHDLILAPFRLQRPPNWEDTRQFSTEEGATYLMDFLPDDETYLDAIEWGVPKRHRRATGQVIRKMRERLDHGDNPSL